MVKGKEKFALWITPECKQLVDDCYADDQCQSRSEYNTKKSGLQQELNGLQEAEQNDYNKYQKDLSNWYNDLSYRQNEYNNAYAQRQQNVSSTLNGLFSVLGIAAQILPFFFI